MRVRKLKQRVSDGAQEVVEVLIAQNNFRSPGLAVLHDDRIELFRLGGAVNTIKLSDISYAREVKWFNHARLLWRKKGFEIKTADSAPIQVAIPEPVALRWQKVLGLVR